MNKTFFILFFHILVAHILIAQESDAIAPKLKFNIEINGEKHQIADGDSIVINEDLIKVTSSDVVTFDYGALSFDYPKNFAFEFDQDFGYKIWTLDGNDYVIMYFEYDVKVELDMFIDQMVSQFGKENCEVVDKRISLGGHSLQGKRINVSLVGVKITYDMFEFESADFKTHLISFQDSKKDDGSDSSEGIATLKLIDQTLKFE